VNRALAIASVAITCRIAAADSERGYSRSSRWASSSRRCTSWRSVVSEMA
jgi:hypothetical protein